MMKETKYGFTVTVDPGSIEPYAGPDVNQKFPGEDDPVWCDRCRRNHRRGAPPEVERERMVQNMAKQIAERIDDDTLLEFRGMVQ